MADEQYPIIGDQNNLMTAPGPGASVANALQAILAQRRQQQQESIINQLTQQRQDTESQNVQSEIATRADQAATNQAYRQGLIEDRQEKAAERQQSQARLSDISDFASTQYPDDQVESDMWRIIEHNPERYEQLAQAILTRREQRANAKTPGFLYTIDAKTGKVTKTDVQDPSGNKYEKFGETHDQQPTAANLPQTYLHPEPDPRDPTGQTFEDVPYVMTPAEYQAHGYSDPSFIQKGFVRGAGGPGHQKLTPEPNPKPAGDIISAPDAAKLATLRAKGTPTHYPEWYKSDFTPKPEDVQAYQQERQSVIGRARVHPDVRDTAIDIENRYPDMPIEDVISQKVVGMPPAQVEQLRSLLHILRAQ